MSCRINRINVWNWGSYTWIKYYIKHNSTYVYVFIFLFYHYVLSYYIPISYNNEIAKVEKMLLMLFSTHRMELFTEIHLVVFNLKS